MRSYELLQIMGLLQGMNMEKARTNWIQLVQDFFHRICEGKTWLFVHSFMVEDGVSRYMFLGERTSMNQI